ncbi:protein F20H11.2 [Aphelenchoides avenae]|nr:protein F20H11.2 [Aphelenchus avenae]
MRSAIQTGSSRALAADEDETHIAQVGTFVEYHPVKLRTGLKHPDPVVETVSLSSVYPPDVKYTMSIPEEAVDSGNISALQLEAAVYACQAHCSSLPSGERMGYLIGDGAGVGKGRTISTIIYENYVLGRTRAIWLSVSSDLKYDAERDLRDIGAEHIPVYSLNKFKYSKISGKENGAVKKGVIFSTYSSLICECRSGTDPAYDSRLKQLLQWCGKVLIVDGSQPYCFKVQDFDGVIIFDECHRAKNLCPQYGGKSTKTGKTVMELQQSLPNARIVYASATGATEPRDMAYMTRLGLWGRGQSFTTFQEFIHAVENRGVGAMEMVAMDMKLRGLYLARQLSFQGVTFRVEEVQLDEEFIRIYDESVRLWMECRRQFQNALQYLSDNMRVSHKMVWAQFWSAHQRFFKYLCIGAKVNACVRIAMHAIAQNKCVVIGLQSTGESQTLQQLEDGEDLDDFVSTSKAVLQNLIEKHFPTGERKLGGDILDDVHRKLAGFDDDERRSRKRRQTPYASVAKRVRQLSITEQNGASDGQSNDDTSGSESTDSDSESEADTETDEANDATDDIYNTLLAEIDSDDDDEDGVKEESGPKDEDSPSGSKENDYEPLVNDEDFNPFGHDLSSADPWAHKQTLVEECLKPVQSTGTKKKAVKKVKKEKRPKIEVDDLVPVQEKRGPMEHTTAHEFMKSSRIVGEGGGSLAEVKAELLAAVERLGKNLPANSLDQLIDELGGPTYVAEMTGRKGRIVTLENGEVTYQMRNADSELAVEYMNMEEKEKFMNGEKLVAVISEAASSGISLQSDRRAANKRRRVHITLELPWSADKAVQQFGRTHRSNQVNAPEYLFLISELAGEKRFASVVAKRLESLGALTHGDRRAAETRDLSQFNLDTKYGREALDLLLRSIVGACEPPLSPPTTYVGDFFKDMRQYLEGVGVLLRVGPTRYTIEREASSLTKFLNRLLGLPVLAQNALFDYFSKIVEDLIRQAKVDGTYDMGIMDLGAGGDRVHKDQTRTFRSCNENLNFVVDLHKIIVERGVDWDEALSIANTHSGPHDGFYVSQVRGSKTPSVALVFGLGKESDGDYRGFCVTRPNTGRSPKVEPIKELGTKYQRVPLANAEKLWRAQYESLGVKCHHMYFYGQCKLHEATNFCEVGRRSRTYFVLSGSVISVWPLLETVLSGSRRSAKMQIVRIRTDDNQKIVGILVLSSHVHRLMEELSRYCGAARPKTEMN